MPSFDELFFFTASPSRSMSMSSAKLQSGHPLMDTDHSGMPVSSASQSECPMDGMVV